MASHGKVLDLFDDRYLELQDVVGNVEPLPTLVPYEQYKQHAITYRMDTNHEIFMALLQDFTERKALETGKELWTWCVQWQVDKTATRRAVAAPHSPKRPRLDSGLQNTPPAQNTSDPELLQQEDMLRILVDIVQVDSTVVPNFIEFLYRWIDFYEGDGKALKAALHGEIPSLWDFEYHPLLVPDEVKKKMDETNGIASDGKEERMRQKPDLAALERKVEESERLKYREVHFGIQPPKLNEPLPPLINIPRDRYKRAKYYDACFKSRQRAFFLLVEAGVTAQNMKDYNRCQTMSLHDTPLLVEADGLRNYEKDAKLAQFFSSLKEKHGAKQLEIAISNKLADEAQFIRSTVPQGSSGGPLIPATTSHAHLPEFSDQILHKIQQTKDEGQQRINVVPIPLVGKMRSALFQGARDKAGLQEILACSSFLPPPRPSANVNGCGTTASDDDAAFRGGMRMLPRPSLPPPAMLPRPSLPPLATLPRPNPPPPASLPRPNLPPPTRPPPTITSTRPQNMFTHNTSLFLEQPHPSGSVTPPAARAVPSREPTPPRIVAFMQDITPDQANQLTAILKQQADLAAGTVRVQQLAQTGQGIMQNPQSIGNNTAFNASYMVQRASNPPMGLDLPLPPRTPVLGTSRAPNITASAPHLPPQHQLPRTFEGTFNPHARSPLLRESEHQRSFLSGYGHPHFGPAPPEHAPTSFQTTHQPNMYQQTHTSPWPTALGRHDHTPPPAFAQRLAAAQETRVHATSYGLLPLAPDLPSLNRQFDQTRSTQERQQSSQNLLLAPSRTMMQRSVPSPLTLRPPASPLTSLATSLLATSPFTTSHRGIPVQVYLPRILVPSNTIGPGGLKLGNNGCAETDAFLLGHTHPKSGKITLNCAIFLPLGVWNNAQDRVRTGRYTVLETYTAPNKAPSVPHHAVYEKAKQAYEMMTLSSPAAREHELTKRWRASRGRMTATERGAVWEGWAVDIDREIAMSKEERRGAFVQDELVDATDENSQEVRRRKEIEELLETDEAWDYEEDGEDDGSDEDVRMHG